MADENITSPALQAAPETSASASVSAETSSPAPSAETSSPAPESTTTPEQTVLGFDDAPAPETKVETKIEIESPPAEKPAEGETKIETKPAEAEKKPAEGEKKSAEGADKTAQPDGEKKEESGQSDEPASLPSFEPWVFPEGMTIPEARVQEINEMFGKFELTSKVDHKALQEFGQQLIDRHTSEIKVVAENVANAYDKVWKDQTKSWYESFVKDPEIGGDKKDLSQAAAREFIRRHGGSSEQQAEIRTLMQKTGIGNHPALIRLFAKATENLGEGKPIPGSKPAGQPLSRKQKFYGSKK